MPEPQATFAGSIPEYYERFLRPMLFQPYAEDLAARAAALPGPVLELACGTGILTRNLLPRLPDDAAYSVTDLNPPMIEEARRRVPEDARIAWRQADMTALPFGDGLFGTVVCQFGFMFPPDKAEAFRECRRVLRDGGTLLFNVWTSLDRNPANIALQRALDALFPDNPSTFLQIPFGFHDQSLITELLQANGFAGLRIEPVVLDCRSAHARDFAIGMVRGTPLANDLSARGADPEQVIDAAEAELAALGGREPFCCPMEALVVQAKAVPAVFQVEWTHGNP
ncbi:MAG TPA: class I SAM-dependent methyltransferase [Holophagaceae bacterium]|nr:class I SAM-dependent methyltransferase [Holophagaceae bacterium]